MIIYKTIKKCRICYGKLKLLHRYNSTPLGEDFINKTEKKKTRVNTIKFMQM